MIYRARRLLGGLVAAVLAAGSATAADVRLSGLIFGQYGIYTTRNDASGNPVRGKGEFDITRIYFGGEAKMSPTVKAKIVLEGNGTGSNADSGHKANPVFLKNAFITWTPIGSLAVDAGMIPCPWIGFEEKIWGRRFVQKTYLDQQGLLNASDKGVGVLYGLPKGYGEVHAVYVNGEGYNQRETQTSGDGRYKDAALRLTGVPLPENDWLKGVKLHVFVQNGQQGSGQAKRRDRYLAGASWQGVKGHLMYSASKSYQGNNVSLADPPTAGSINRRTWGQSVHGSYRFQESASVFGRFDHFSTEATGVGASATDAFDRGILGADYRVAEGVTLSLNDQWLTPLTGVKKNENQVLLQFEAKF